VLTLLFLALHYHRRILLFFAPWLGGVGRNIQARWGGSDIVH
jgi:undecaprenyl-diphosphatase